MLTTTFLIFVAYLWGGIPSAYMAGRFLKGIDIRTYGSGTVGASNVIEHIGLMKGFFLGIFDSVGKGTLVIIVAKLLDQSVPVQITVGLVAVVGHNWSPYIRFTGGRGIATLTGVMLGFLMWREMLFAAVMIGIVGKMLMRDTALMAVVTLMLFPVLELLLGQIQFTYMFVAATVIIILKRLLANWEIPDQSYPILSVVVNRILWDRDVPRGANWTSRKPD
jgi:glycerol-3-phosphate acyltransferase PlsY